LHRRERHGHGLLSEPEESPDPNDDSFRGAVPIHQQVVNLSDLLVVLAVNPEPNQLWRAPLGLFLSGYKVDA
jgi:hypothetical protein